MTSARWIEKTIVCHLGLVLGLAGCATTTVAQAPSRIEGARLAAENSSDGEAVGLWLLHELVARGGDVGKARQARARLDKLPHNGMYASLALATDDAGHGHLESAVDAYLSAIRAARSSSDEHAPLVAWFSSNHLLGLIPNASGLWDKARPVVEDLIARPGFIGWRARAELVTWRTQQAYRAREGDTAEASTDQHGCLRNVRLAGPFGHNAPGDRRRAFAAEAVGPWPRTFVADRGIHIAPHQLTTERHGCQVRSSEAVPPGIFYGETFIDLPAERDVLLAVQGAYHVSIDDQTVLDRGAIVWGIWGKFSVQVRLARGRHRILARLSNPETSIRAMRPDGTPLGAPSSSDPSPPYSLVAPVVEKDPNVLDRFVARGMPVPVEDDVGRYLASFLAHVEDEDDVASVILEPLVQEAGAATPVSLALAAVFAERDPVFPESDRHDLARDLRERAAAKDPELFWPRVWLALDEAEKKGLPDAATAVRKLAEHFPEVPEISEGLAQLYMRLNWTAERTAVLREVAARFPRNVRVQQELLVALEEQGRHLEADEIAARIKDLDHDADVEVDRALARRDYKAASTELRRLGERRPDRKEVADRIADVLTQAGERTAGFALLERAVSKNPRDPGIRLGLADARFAVGQKMALRTAIADAILQGASTAELSDAAELVEGVTELEPYRIDGLKIIKEYEAAGAEMEGNAARVVDYSAVWVHPDGSSRMLEHELLRIQSQEAIGKLAEQKLPNGLILKMRVIKKDGRILEPELVSGKKTATMPHLELGDYIETESVTREPGDGQLGQRYLGPQWFFREEDIAYWRSEFIVISPKDKPLQIETRGDVPAPEVRDQGALVVRRWRVEKSPAAPDEPASAPIQEFLPSVRVGFGVTLVDRLDRLTDAVSDQPPRDPRLIRIASQIVGDEKNEADKARLLYRWVLSNVEEGRESDGRRVVVGKSGNRTSAFVYLCRTLGIPVAIAITRNRLNPAPLGPISEAEQFDDFVVRVGSTRPEWLTVADKFAPFGYLPSGLRGQPAYLLSPGTARVTTSAEGGLDGVFYEGDGEIASDGSAKLELAQKFVGESAMSLRAGLERLPPAQLHDAIESKLLAQAIPGARLGQVKIENQADLDQPLVMRMGIDVSDFAHRRGRDLVLPPPFPIRISQVAALPRRQTPLLLGQPTYAKVRLSLKLPPNAKVISSLSPGEVKNDDRKVWVHDRQEGGTLVLERLIDLPAGRVEPSGYEALRDFAQRADEMMMRDIVIATDGAARP
jgi:tetratricopeptide (TPR) repeat protein